MALAYQGLRHGFANGRASDQRILSEKVCRGGCKPQTVLRTLAAFFDCSHHRILEFTRRYFQHGMQLRVSFRLSGVVTFASSAQVTPRSVNGRQSSSFHAHRTISYHGGG